MKTLIKISNYYYVVDYKAMIFKGDYEIKTHGTPIEVNKALYDRDRLSHSFSKIIATTNPNIPLPQIINSSDELVGKEIEVEFTIGCPNCKENYLHPFNSENETVCSKCSEVFTKQKCKLTTIKPISKETSTNETLEEVAETFSKEYNGTGKIDKNEVIIFIAGYKYVESKLNEMFEKEYKSSEKHYKDLKSKMYSEETVLNIIDFIINNAKIEDKDLFINYQLLNSQQVLQEYKDRNNKK